MEFLATYWPLVLAGIAYIGWHFRHEHRTNTNEKEIGRVETAATQGIAAIATAFKESLESHAKAHKEALENTTKFYEKEIYRIERSYEKAIDATDKKIAVLFEKYDTLDSKVFEQLTEVREALARIEGTLQAQNNNKGDSK